MKPEHFIITLQATAEIEERWLVTATDEAHARQIAEDGMLHAHLFIGKRVTGEERNREVMRVAPATENSADDAEPKAFIIYGNPVDGFNFRGPFADRFEAIAYAEWADGDDWTIAELTPPETEDFAAVTQERGGDHARNH
nr:hypothetical protein DBT41_14270 [Aerococcus urinae]